MSPHKFNTSLLTIALFTHLLIVDTVEAQTTTSTDLALGDKAYAQGRLMDAVNAFKKARLTATANKLGELEVAKVSHRLGNAYEKQHLYGSARPLLTEALTVYEKRLGANHLDVAALLKDFSRLNFNCGKYAEAQEYLERALKIQDGNASEDPVGRGASLCNLSWIYAITGQYRAAETACEQAISIVKANKTLHSRLVYYRALLTLADCYSEERKYHEATQQYEIAKKIMGTHFWQFYFDGMHNYDPTGDSFAAAGWTQLAGMYCTEGEIDKGIALYRRAIEIRERTLGRNDLAVAFSQNLLARQYFLLGDMEKARPLFERSLVIRKRKLGAHSLAVGVSLENMADVLVQSSEASKAEVFRAQAQKTRNRGNQL